MKQTTLFITGTDTDVGKTHIGQRLAAEIYARGHAIEPRKVVESGCEETEEGLRGPDALAYFKACDGTVPLSRINPYQFRAALAPPAAAMEEGKALKLQQLVDGCAHDDKAMLLAEGAGGWLSPIADDAANADLAAALNAEVIIVAADRLGCLNHTLLTAEAVERRGLNVKAIVLNSIHEDQSSKTNGSWLRENTSYPLFIYGSGDVEDLETISNLAGLVIHTPNP